MPYRGQAWVAELWAGLAVVTPAQAASLCSEQELAVPVGPKEESLTLPSSMPCLRVGESETYWAGPSI